MRKLIPLLLFVLIANISTAQKIEYIPKEYQFKFDRLKERINTGETDRIFLDPIEQVPIIPTEFSSRNGGNWAYDYLQIGEFSDQIYNKATRKVAIFIFDTAGEFDHPSLAKAAWNQKGRVFNRKNPPDFNGHGTHVAGIVGASEDGVNIGIAEALTRKGLLFLIPYKVLDESGMGFNSDIVNAIKVANSESQNLISQGYFVIYNFSLGGQSVNSSFNVYLKEAEDTGVFVVGATGNNGVDFIGTPANGESTHAIGSIDPSELKSGFSNYGEELYLTAPGARLFSTWLNGQYRELSGTSMATPCVAGIAAIVASINENATNRQVSHFLRIFNKDLGKAGWDELTGYGSSLVSKWFDKDASREADQGNGNPNTPNFDPEPIPDPEPGADKRKIVHVLRGQYRLHWKPLDKSQYSTSQVNMCVEFNSRLNVLDANQVLKEKTELFFNENGIWISENGDMHDAAFWARHFYEKEIEDVEVVYMTVNDGNGVEVEVSQRGNIATGLKKLFNPEIRNLKISTNGK